MAKSNMPEGHNGLSSDLEWMLNGNQADREMLTEALLQEHYLSIYRLALALLGNPRTAHQAAMQTIAKAALDFPRRRNKLEINSWLYGYAVKIINSMPRSALPSEPRLENLPVPVETSSRITEEADFCQVFENYGFRERYTLVLTYILRWTPEDVASLLRVNERAVEMQLDLSRRKLFDALGPDAEDHPKPLAGLSDQQILAEERHYMDDRLVEAFQSCWPAPDLSQSDWERIRKQIETYESTKRPTWQRISGGRELLLILAAILLIVGLGWGLGIVLGENSLPTFSLLPVQRTPPEQAEPTSEVSFPPEGEGQGYLYEVQAGDSLASVSLALGLPQELITEWNGMDADAQLVPGQELLVMPYAVNYPPPSPVPSAPDVRQLKKNDESATILQALRNSSNNWNTLWIDTQSIDYGPPGYIGAARIYHSQAWVDQPAQSLELLGLLDEHPSSVQMISEGKRYLISPESELPSLSVWNENREPLLYYERLRQMVYPQTGIWAYQEGRFESMDREEIAGREAIVVDWYNNSGNRQVRLWLDSATGLALRVQEFDGPDFQTLIADSVVTSILYNLEIPQDALFDPHILVSQDFAVLSEEGASAEEPSETSLSIPLDRRSTLPGDPAPPGYDPRGSWLHFQFSLPVGQNPALGSTAEEPADLFADGYWLGQVGMPPPWGLQCTRSPDGLRLAFNTKSDGIHTSNSTLRWLNLQDLQEIYEPLPGFQAEYFAFSPDSRKLAVSGYDPQDSFRGLKIVDIGTGESQPLIQFSKADSLVWSPDGAYLALVGQKVDSPGDYIIIIQVRMGEVIFERPVELSGSTQQFTWSSMAWGMEFPLPMGDMGSCAQPP